MNQILKEKLIAKYGYACSKCGQKNNLSIEHTDGQSYLELEYFGTLDSMWDYYDKNFDRESEFVSFFCAKCKETIPNPRHPTLTEFTVILNDLVMENKTSEVPYLFDKYSHVLQTGLRMLESSMSDIQQELKRRGII